MAEPARQLSGDEEPETKIPVRIRSITSGRARVQPGGSSNAAGRPSLQGLPGGGQGDGTPAGNLAEAPAPDNGGGNSEDNPTESQPEPDPNTGAEGPAGQPDEPAAAEDNAATGQPDLQALEGGQEGDGTPAGDLAAIPEEPVYDEPTGINPSPDRPDLKALEGGAAAGTGLGAGRSHQHKPDEKGENADAPSREDLANAEEEPDAQKEEGVAQHENQVGSGYKKFSKNQRRGWKRYVLNKKTGIGGGVVGLIIGGIFGFSVLQGPLQFLQVGHDMMAFHFSHMQNQSDGRFSSMISDVKKFKALKEGKGYERTRMGKLGNRYADKFVNTLSENGVELKFNNVGTFEGYELDLDKNPKLGEVLDEAGIENPGSGTVKVARGDFGGGPKGYLKFRGFTSGLLEQANYSKLSQSIGMRLITARTGVTWHALTEKYGDMTRQALYKALNKQQSEDVEEGQTAEVSTQEEANAEAVCKDKGSNSTECKNAKDAAEQAQQEAESTNQVEQEGSDARESQLNGDSAAASSFKESIKSNVKGASVTAVVGMACALNGLNKNWDKIRMAQTVLPLIRFSVKFVSIASQVQSGQDLDLGQLGYYSQFFYDDSKDKNDPYAQTGWQNSATQIAEERNAGISDQAMPPDNSAVQPDSTLTGISKSSPLSFMDTVGLKQTLRAVCNPVGGAIIGVLSFLGGGSLESKLVSTFVGLVAGQFVSEGANKVADLLGQWLMGEPVTPFPKGAQTGNYLNFGARLAANSQAITDGGGALTNSQVAQLDQDEEQKLQSNFDSEPLADRLFDPYNPQSFIAKFITSQGPNVAQDATVAVSKFANIFSPIKSLSSYLFGHKALAAGNVNLDQIYGFPEYGFSDAEMQEVGDPYDNSIKAANLLDEQCTDQQGDPVTSCSLIQQAAKCFHDNIVGTPETDSQGDKYNQWDVQVGTQAVDVYSGYNSTQCGSDDPDWLSIRFFIFDTATMKSMACYEGDSQSCLEIGFNDSENAPAGSATSSPTSSPSTGSLAPSGSAQQLAQQILSNSNIDLSCYSSSVKQDIESAAANQPGTAGVMTSSVVLQLIATVGQSHKVCITAVQSNGQGHCNGKPKSDCPDDPHYNGDAVDFGNLDGAGVTGRNAPSLAIINLTEGLLPNGSRYGQAQCGTTPTLPSGITSFTGDPCTHLHIDVPKGTP